MSGYQYVGFRAIDSSLTDDALEFMEKQSTRAEVTRWSFSNEYHFGDFHGDATEMLRRGYDIHLHYANYGIRNLFIRLPNGFPDRKAAAHYLADNSVTYLKDKKGRSGIFCIEPFFESDDADEIWNLDELLELMIPLRAEILTGDLRPLYIAYLAIHGDGNHEWDKPLEAPVPAGLKKPSIAQLALAKYLSICSEMLTAAAKNSPAIPSGVVAHKRYEAWLKVKPESKKTAWLVDLLADPQSSVRRKLLAEFQKETEAPLWPTTGTNQTISELMDEAQDIRGEREAKAAARAEKERQEQLEKMASDPQSVLRETEKLVKERSTSSYEKAAKLLADLREVLAGTTQTNLPKDHAKKLRKNNPTLTRLTGALRREGFLPKK